MKFGFLTMGCSLEEHLDCAVRAEQRGFESLWLPDHLVMPSPIPASYPYLFDEQGNCRLSPDAPLYDPWVVISHLASRTSTLQFGTAVYLLALRHPLATARALVTLDQLSGGRVMLGVGVGWLKEEFDALELPFERRGALTDEIIGLLRRLWHEQTIAHAGDFYRIPAVGFAPKPMSRSGIPILIGGASPAALRRAGTLGDGWLDAGSASLDEIAAQIGAINQQRKAAGRDHLPFDITLVGNGIFHSPEMVARAAELGVTRIVVNHLENADGDGGAWQGDCLGFIDHYAETVIGRVATRS